MHEYKEFEMLDHLCSQKDGNANTWTTFDIIPSCTAKMKCYHNDNPEKITAKHFMRNIMLAPTWKCCTLRERLRCGRNKVEKSVNNTTKVPESSPTWDGILQQPTGSALCGSYQQKLNQTF
jgi:hypothetical protein